MTAIFGDGPVYRLEQFVPNAVPLDADRAAELPSRLLRARYQVVAFSGRRSELAELTDWLDHSGALSVLLLHGPGGQGKTRLATHFAAAAGEAGWEVSHARHQMDDPAGERSRDYKTARRGVRGRLILVDYAERWPSSHLRSLFSDPLLRGGVPVRVLLVARPVGLWWQFLRSWLEDESGLPTRRLELRPLGQEISRQELFGAAYRSFRTALAADVSTPMPLPPGLDTDPGFEQVLAVHMAALAAADGHHRGVEVPDDPARVSAYLLNRERALWTKLHTRSNDPIATSPTSLSQSVFISALAGPLSWTECTDVLQRTQVINHPADAAPLLNDHDLCYPSSSDALSLEPLHPDRLAEDFVALMTPGHNVSDYAANPWALQAHARLLAIRSPTVPAFWTPRVLTVLIAAAARWVHLQPVLGEALRGNPELALTISGATLATLADLPGIALDVLDAIHRLLPERNIDLDTGSAAIVARLAQHYLATSGDVATKSYWHRALAKRLAGVGDYEQALVNSSQALALTRNADRSTRFWVLLDHATLLKANGQSDAAFPVSEEAVRLGRGLATRDRDANLPNLAASLSNHAVLLAEIGRRDAAILASQEAVLLFSETADRGTHLQNFARSLGNHAIRLVEAGRRDEALSLSEQVVHLFRQLVERDRGTHLPDLATSLSNHAARLVEIGHYAAAHPLSEEAVDLYTDLVRLNRVHLPALATALTNHSNRLAETGYHAVAVTVSAEAVDLGRELVGVNRDAYLLALVASLSSHALRLAETRQHAAAVSVLAEVVDFRRELAELNRDAHLPQLANSLANHAMVLAQAGHHEAAIPLSDESVRLRRELAEIDPDAYLPDLAKSLNNHALILEQAEQCSAALQYAAEAVLVRQELTERLGDAHVLDLAGSLTNQAMLLARVERLTDALACSERAIDLYAHLGGSNRAALLPRLVPSLVTHGYLLLANSRFGEAVRHLMDAGVLARELPGDTEDIAAQVSQHLRSCYRGDPEAVTAAFRSLTGLDPPTWIYKR